MRAIAALNAGLRFVLDSPDRRARIWGWTVPATPRFGRPGLGAPLLLIVLWAAFIAPRSRSPLDQRTRFVVGSGLLLVAAAALWAAGSPAAAAALGILNVGNTLLAFVFPLPELLDRG
jgi:hypothetical protein